MRSFLAALFLLLMPLSGTILANKDAGPQGYQPLLLVQFTFGDGSVLWASTHNLNTAEGGTPYQGASYVARIQAQDIEAIQSRSQQGIDRIAEVNLHLFNADQTLYTNYESFPGRGFKGALVKLSLVLCDIDPASGAYLFTTDSPAPVKFSGICEAPDGGNGEILTVRATTSKSLARVQFPIIRVQQRCVNPFPPDQASRQAGAMDMGSWFWSCGYSPDISGTDPEIGGAVARGNTTTPNAVDASGNIISDANGIYITCNYTKQDCQARGMFQSDNFGRATGRFTAIQWAPLQPYYRAKSYTQGKYISVFESRNDSIFNQSYPMVYGVQWIKPLVANIIGDGNATRFQIVLCVGDVGPNGVLQVVVNGVIIPAWGPGMDVLYQWNWLDFPSTPSLSTHTGSRNGYATRDLAYGLPQGNSDPYGGLATIGVVVYNDLAQSGNAPDVRVLMANGPKVKVPNTANPADQASWPYVQSSSPVWVLLDLLIWANYSYADIDIQSFLNADAVCGVPVTSISITGQTVQLSRFACEMALQDHQAANEVIQAVCRSFNAQLVPNSDTGLLQLFIRQTLADQQPNPITGSNYNTPIQSLHANGSVGQGYVAYLIDESVIQQDGKGTPKIRGPYSQPTAQTPNRITFGFQDQQNSHAEDSISVVDTDDIQRAGGYQPGGQQVPQQLNVLGVPNFDQGIRVANVMLAEGIRGNENGDTRGTRWWDIEDATSRLEHLHVGHLVLLRYQAINLKPNASLQSPPGVPIAGILARVESIKPTTDYERVTLTVRWHEDAWYTDKYGQQPAQFYSDPKRHLPQRPPYPWHPYGEQPMAGDAYYGSTEWNFRISQSYESLGDSSQSGRLLIAGNAPVAQLGSVQPPVIASQALAAASGGTVPANTHITLGISAQDASGNWSPLSALASVITPNAAGSTCTVTIPSIAWQPGTVGYTLFAGYDEQTLCEQVTGSGTPNSLTMIALNLNTYGPPDILADSLVFQIKRFVHGGCWGDTCTSVTSHGDGTGTIGFSKNPLTSNQFVGYELACYAKQLGSESFIPLQNFKILDHTGSVLHVTPDPVASGVSVGDIFGTRSQARIVSATTIGDPNFQNAYTPLGLLDPNYAQSGQVRITKGTGVGQIRQVLSMTNTTVTVDHAWDTLPDATSRFVIEETTWQDGLTVKVSSSQFTAVQTPDLGFLDVTPFNYQPVLVQALVQDANGNRSLRRWSPIREVFLWGYDPTLPSPGGAAPANFTLGTATYNWRGASQIFYSA